MPGTWLYENHPQWLLKPHARPGDTLAGMRAGRRSAGRKRSVRVAQSHVAGRSMANIRWEPGRLSFHPGPKGEYSVVRFTAPEAGPYAVQAAFLAIDRDTTTDVHVCRAANPRLTAGSISTDRETKTTYEGKLALGKGEALDFVVGWGNGSHVCDSTGLEARLTGPSGKTFDAARSLARRAEPRRAVELRASQARRQARQQYVSAV
jgi:alpha-galactosidase